MGFVVGFSFRFLRNQEFTFKNGLVEPVPKKKYLRHSDVISEIAGDSYSAGKAMFCLRILSPKKLRLKGFDASLPPPPPPTSTLW